MPNNNKISGKTLLQERRKNPGNVASNVQRKESSSLETTGNGRINKSPVQPGFFGTSLLNDFREEYPPVARPDDQEEEREESIFEKQAKSIFSSTTNCMDIHNAAVALCQLLVLTSTDERRRFIYSLNSSLLVHDNKCLEINDSPISEALLPSFELTVLKGSIKTHAWSMVARYDDEYLLETRNLPEYKEAWCNSSYPLGSSNELQLLWTMSGYDFHTSHVGLGVVSWNNVRSLHRFLCHCTARHIAGSMMAIGVTTFSELFSKLILSLPMRETLGYYQKPMPSTLMLLDMLRYCSYPCEVVGFNNSDFEDVSIQSVLRDLVARDGTGAWIENLYPEKLYDCKQSGEMQWETKALRVVEIRKCVVATMLASKTLLAPSCFSNSNDMLLVLAVFSEKCPQERFVTTQVGEICRHVRKCALPSDENVECVESPPITDIELYSELEWKEALIDFVIQEEREMNTKTLRNPEEVCLEELDILGDDDHHDASKKYVIDSVGETVVINSFLEKDIAPLDLELDVVKEEEEEGEVTLTDDSNNIVFNTAFSNGTVSSQRSRSMTLDSIGTFDTLDSVDFEFISLSEQQLEKKKISRNPFNSLRTREDEYDRGTSNEDCEVTVASIYNSFRNTPVDEPNSQYKLNSKWNLQNIGTFGISFKDDATWGSERYHSIAISQRDKSVKQGVIISHRQTSTPYSKHSMSVDSLRKRKSCREVDFLPRRDVNATEDSSCGLSSRVPVSSEQSSDNESVYKIGPASSYKLYDRSVSAINLWSEGSTVFVPARGLLSQFSLDINKDIAEKAQIKLRSDDIPTPRIGKKSRSGDEKYFFEAVVAHRTNRQVTLFISVINKEVKRGLNFMENQCKKVSLREELFVLQEEHVIPRIQS